MGQERQLVGAPVEVRVRLQWRAAGELTLDASGKPAFGPLEAAPGLYRLELASLNEQQRPLVYFGETDNLRRRLSGNYRNPGPSQQTSARINGLLREHLARGGSVSLSLATEVDAEVDGVPQRLDLSTKAARLPAESAPLVGARTTHASRISAESHPISAERAPEQAGIRQPPSRTGCTRSRSRPRGASAHRSRR
ncbi:MAG: hypothetical protein HHJ10_07420 [Cellulomonas sp.]|uniref:hypothetical protein n=1 Tax=Cellulomonas sp. TaxID=40001 RepID=UPI00179A2E70|nr:hypothetical protein [Cellulomonas sp.]NMM30860.1 hypothetical protein [Cellulomonas sp.]